MTRAQLLAGLPSRLDEPVRWNETDDAEFRWLLECERRRLRLERFANIENLDDQEEAERIEWQLCALDTRYWIENNVWIESPHESAGQHPEMAEMPLVLWDGQIEKALPAIEDAIDNGKDLPITKGRSLGMSWLVLVVLYHRFTFRKRFSARAYSRVEDNVDDSTPESLFGKWRFMHERLPRFLRPILTRDKHMHIEAANGSRLMGESTTKGLSRGKRCAVLYGDEYAHIEPNIQRQIKLASTTVARSRIWTSTPNGPGDDFAWMVNHHPNLLRMTFEDNPTFTREFIAAERARLGPEMFAQEYMGEIQSIAGARIWQLRRSRVEYHDQDPRFDVAMRDRLALLCGWDFGEGRSMLASIWALSEWMPNGKIRLWVDQELCWYAASWRSAAADCLMVKGERYPSNAWHHTGDPSGVSPESDQESWESNLRAGGIPMHCLPLSWNNRQEAEWGIKFVQDMLDDGRLLVHQRCRVLWDSLEMWRRSLPKGVDIDELDRAYIRPDHGKHSHAAWALVYLVRAALAIEQASLDANAPKKPKDKPGTPPPKQSPAEQIAAVLPGRGLRGSPFSGTLGGR